MAGTSDFILRSYWRFLSITDTIYPHFRRLTLAAMWEVEWKVEEGRPVIRLLQQITMVWIRVVGVWIYFEDGSDKICS